MLRAPKAPTFTGFKLSELPLTDDWGVVRYTAIGTGHVYWYMYHGCGALVRDDLGTSRRGLLDCRLCKTAVPLEIKGYFEVCRW
jgi:hypothetical protein